MSRKYSPASAGEEVIKFFTSKAKCKNTPLQVRVLHSESHKYYQQNILNVSSVKVLIMQ